MSDDLTGRLTDPDTGQPLPAPSRGSRSGAWGDAARFVAAVLGAYAVLGAALGWVWFQLWTPQLGVVSGHQWYASVDALRGDFSGTGLYVLIAGGAGVVLGLAAAFLGGREPMVTLFAAVAGSVLAAWLMLMVGQALGPDDPAVLAKTAKDGVQLSSALRVSGLSPVTAFPMGTLAALALVFTVFPGRRESRPGREPRR